MTTSTKELLINGYIREIKTVLAKDTIISIDIISLCLLFWSKSTKFIIIHSNATKISIYDIDTKQISSVNYSATDHRHLSPPICYISNIPPNTQQFTLEDGLLYDATLMIDAELFDSARATLLTFDSGYSVYSVFLYLN